MQEDALVSDGGHHSWDSDDSSSYEEREKSSVSFGTGSDAGDHSMDAEAVRRKLAADSDFDPSNPPPLKHLLAKKSWRKLLEQFAGTLLAEENVMFWELAQRYRLSPLETRPDLLRTAIDEFITQGSPHMVNIAGTERARLVKLYSEKGTTLCSDPDLFNNALAECVKVMELDLYPKFLALVKTLHGGKDHNKHKKTPPLWEILNDPEELNALLLFAAANNQQDDILFWCLVQRFREEADRDTRQRLAVYLVQQYVDANAPRMIRVDKTKKAACAERFAEVTMSKADIPLDLFDAVVREATNSMNKHLHPAYEKSQRKGLGARLWGGGAGGSGGSSGTGSATGSLRPSSIDGERNMIKEELEEAMRDNSAGARPGSRSWVPVQGVARTAASPSGSQSPISASPASAGRPITIPADDKKKLLGAKRGKTSPRSEKKK